MCCCRFSMTADSPMGRVARSTLHLIMILTSNMGFAVLIDTDVPFAERRDQVLAVVRQQFRPEFLNRLDAMVMFNPLDREELMRIARIQIEQAQRRLDTPHFDRVDRGSPTVVGQHRIRPDPRRTTPSTHGCKRRSLRWRWRSVGRRQRR